MDETIAGVIASGFTLALYCLAALTKERPARGLSRFNPLVITAGHSGRASLSKLQIFWFTLIVVWMLAFYLLHNSALTDLSETVLMLIGASAAGTIGGKVTAVSRKRLSMQSWSWLCSKRWVENETGGVESRVETPELAHLLQGGGEFDAAKFQMLAISAVVGVAMIVWGIKAGSLEDFEVPTNVLGLIALSQGVYIVGKAVGPATVAELEKKVSELRELERGFATAVGAAWKEKAPTAAVAKDPSKAAPEEFNRYMAAVRPAAEMVREVVGCEETKISAAQMLPAMPTYGKPVEAEAVALSERPVSSRAVPEAGGQVPPSARRAALVETVDNNARDGTVKLVAVWDKVRRKWKLRFTE